MKTWRLPLVAIVLGLLPQRMTLAQPAFNPVVFDILREGTKYVTAVTPISF